MSSEEPLQTGQRFIGMFGLRWAADVRMFAFETIYFTSAALAYNYLSPGECLCAHKLGFFLFRMGRFN